MKSLLLLVTLLGCATSRHAYLFPRGKQKHRIVVRSPDAQLKSQSESFLILSETELRLTALSPVALTLMKIEMKRGETPRITYLNAALEPQRPLLLELAKRLGALFWARGEPSGVVVFDRFQDGTARDLEWTVAKQKIRIEVEKL